MISPARARDIVLELAEDNLAPEEMTEQRAEQLEAIEFIRDFTDSFD